jgi:hypothetical protein
LREDYWINPTKYATSKSRSESITIFTVLVLISSILFISLDVIVPSVSASETEPYTIYGTVKNGNGIVIEGAIVTVANLNTDEKSSDGNDTITGNPISLITDSDGKYTFDLLNLKSAYSDLDQIQVTAEKDNEVDQESIIVEASEWGARIDITLGDKENRENEQWFGGISIILLSIVIIILVILTSAYTMSERYKSKEIPPPEFDLKEGMPPPTPNRSSKKKPLSTGSKKVPSPSPNRNPKKKPISTGKKKLPPPPPSWKHNMEKLSSKDEKEPPPPDEEEEKSQRRIINLLIIFHAILWTLTVNIESIISLKSLVL